jgi:hypothetical protein
MASQKISQFSAITVLASGDYFPVIQSSGTSNKRVDVGVLDVRYAATASGEVAHEALASGNAALVEAAEALASGNSALTDLSTKYNITGGPITGTVTTQSQSIGQITDSALTSGLIALNFATGNNFEFVLGGNSTLNSPTNVSGGQTGVITIRQDDVGSRTLAYSGVWNFAAGTAPTLTTTASGVDILSFYCTSPTEVQAVVTADYK